MEETPLEDFLSTIEAVTGSRPDSRQAIAMLMECAVGPEGWYRPERERVTGSGPVTASPTTAGGHAGSRTAPARVPVGTPASTTTSPHSMTHSIPAGGSQGAS